MNKPIAVVTINWNGADNTLRCLAALRASERVAWHLYVVDNASTDGSADRLAREMSVDGQLGDGDVTLIRSPVNGGWTGGNNRGIERALAAGHDLVFILNNDAFVRPDTLAILVDTLALDSHGGAATLPVLGPVHQGAGSASYDFRVSHRDPKTGIPVWTLPVDQGPETRQPTYPTGYISGAGMLIHRRHLDAIGLLDDRFYLNFDDTDWCARAELAGFPLLMV
ncbi:MAG: glycosyltransferase family 2 protein, partial [Lysobacteraceae bacterium]